MGPLSSYEVEQICESCYNQAVEFFSRYDYLDDADKFALTVEGDFVDWSSPQLNYRISNSQINIVHKWRSKLRTEARTWYKDNIERPRENERNERKRREQEEREREEQREEQAKRERELRRQIEAEENRRREEEERIREEEERQRREEEAIAQAKRKEQNELNKQRLVEIQAKWKARNNPAQQTSAQPQTSAPVEAASCPQCGGLVKNTSKFCANCGAKLSLTCSSCGASLKPTSKFCPDCGTPASNSTNVSLLKSASQSFPQRSLSITNSKNLKN